MSNCNPSDAIISRQHFCGVRTSSLVAVLSLGLLCCGSAIAADFTPDQLEFFEKKIRPILSEQCYKCHSAGAEKLKGGLMLDSREAAIKGGDTRAAIVPGDPGKSLLIEAVGYANQDMQMPPKTKLSAAQVADLTTWVKQGAAWPAETAPKKIAKESFDLEKRKREHWSWETLKEQPLPAVKDAQWGKNPIDRFILAKLEAKNLRPAVAAQKHTLIRRAYFDLTGLPPAPAEVEAFVKDESADAFAKVVDRVLASPAFGERWARHWLDLVRYAETRGHEFEPIIPNAYQYRDYLIRAFNADVPYNQFVTEHVAGDLMPKPRLEPTTKTNESILGTGFWFLGEEVHSPVDIRQDETDRLDNRLDVMSKTFLGMTVACARCHDHKFDAISQRDYYAMTGFLISSTYRQVPFTAVEAHREIAGQLAKWRSTEQPKLLQATAQALRPGIERTAKFLLAAAAPQAAPAGGGGQAAAPDAEQITRWTAALKLAASDPAHPLHAFSREERDPATQRPKRPRTKGEQRIEPAATSGSLNIVVDYAKPGPRDWLQDGWSFGSHCAVVGDIIPGSSDSQPIAGIINRGAAVRDPAWNGLTVNGAERDGGTLGNWQRSGQTLRTPDFDLKGKAVWYLVRGSVRAYAAMNSHLVIQGPLHGSLLREFKDDKYEWRWLEHRLDAYSGHRLHVQFSPVGNAPLSIAMVVQSDAKPQLQLPDSPSKVLQTFLDKVEDDSAVAIQKAFTSVAAEMKTGGFTSPSSAALADWLVRNLDLFCPPGSAERQKLSEAVKPALARHAELTASVKPVNQTAPAMLDGNGVDEFLLVRGQSKLPGERTPRRFLEAIAGAQPPTFKTGSGRLELAGMMTDSSNPFTSRVMVNRVWHHLFGRGIVPSVDNFGVLGQPPSHRELLDYLAVHFMRDQAWSVKKLIRELMLTRTYQMGSAPADEKAETEDPENLLFHRMNLRRLEAEAIRDAMLGVSGRLDPKVGGPSVMVHLTPFMDGRGKPGSGPLDGNGRRSIYISVRRNFLPPMLLAFDMPIPFTSMGRRNVSNVPAQALMLMNDPFVVEQTRVWAKKLAPIAEPAERVRQMYLTAFSRPPRDAELSDALAFVGEQSKAYATPPTDERVWADLCHVMFNVKEFIYLN